MASLGPPPPIIIESKNSSKVSWDNKEPHPSPLASHPFRIPTLSFSDLDIPSELQYSRRFSDMMVAGTRTSYLGGDLHDTIRHGENVRSRRSRNDVAALVEFLRTHEPPPDNFMSQPFSTDRGERGRWDKIKVMGSMRRSKSMPRAPPPIRLPDSAVAGVTTGGHHHIAISIPLEASHFGDRPKSQYPVFGKDPEPVPSIPDGVRTFRNEKGVITVLRPLSNDYSSGMHASPPSPRRFERDTPPQSLRSRRMVSSSAPPSSPADSESWPLTYTEYEDSLNTHQSQLSYEYNEKSRQISNGGTRPTSEFIRAAYPSRGSSMVATPRVHHRHATSIDEVIAEEEPYNRNPSPMPRLGGARRKTERRVGHPPVTLATSPVARKSTPNLRPGWQFGKENTPRQSRITQITDIPVIDRREQSPSPPASIISAKSRRAKVRDKKLRDLAAARSSKLGSKPTQTRGNSGDEFQVAANEVADNESGPKLSSIMVVVDMEPDDGKPANAPRATKNDDSESATEMLPGPVLKPHSSASHRSIPTPPASAETSPARKHGFDTRTSLTRRREWQTSREQERKKREATALAKAQLRQFTASGRYGNSIGGFVASEHEREMFRLYEAYREQRLRDMESRVRRLERNGDVWLRALMPMLEDMKSSAHHHRSCTDIPRARLSIKDDESMRDWASDDEATAGGMERRGRASERRRLTRRASLSSERMLRELMRRDGYDMPDDCDTEQDSAMDASGMGSIEPLMRELAGGQAPSTTTTMKTMPDTWSARPRTLSKVSEGDMRALPMGARRNNFVRVS